MSGRPTSSTTISNDSLVKILLASSALTAVQQEYPSTVSSFSSARKINRSSSTRSRRGIGDLLLLTHSVGLASDRSWRAFGRDRQKYSKTGGRSDLTFDRDLAAVLLHDPFATE